jgi:cytochrome c biogenesis factor
MSCVFGLLLSSAFSCAWSKTQGSLLLHSCFVRLGQCLECFIVNRTCVCMHARVYNVLLAVCLSGIFIKTAVWARDLRVREVE